MVFAGYSYFAKTVSSVKCSLLKLRETTSNIEALKLKCNEEKVA